MTGRGCCPGSCRGPCARATCGCRYGNDLRGARSRGYSGSPAARCSCTSACWPTPCGTAPSPTATGESRWHSWCFVKFTEQLKSLIMSNCVNVCCSSTPVSALVSVNAETLWAGLVSCLLVYPVYLLVFCLFRLSRSKVRHTHAYNHPLTKSQQMCKINKLFLCSGFCGAASSSGGPGVSRDR